ncbi:MAG: PilZ domain-containing protein [Planctomycetota bacterium]
MFNQPTHGDVCSLEALDALSDLERNKSDSVRQARSSIRIRLRASVRAEPGSPDQRQAFSVEGVSSDLSTGGCQLLFPRPLRVGDFYLLTFDHSSLRLEPLLSRCLRVRMVREDAFEAGMKFLEPVDMDDAFGQTQDDCLFD